MYLNRYMRDILNHMTTPIGYLKYDDPIQEESHVPPYSSWMSYNPKTTCIVVTFLSLFL